MGSRDLYVQTFETVCQPRRPSLQRASGSRDNNGSEEAKGKKQKFIKGSNIKREAEPDSEGLRHILLHPMNILLLFLPIGSASHYLNWGDSCKFWTNFLAMIPLAKMLGDATEELAANLKNDMIAGLLNATFGNAVEVVIMVQTLRAGLVRLVKTSLLGSVLSNTLLVLGMSFLCGGIFTLRRDTEAEGADAAGALRRETSHFELNEKIQSFSILGALVNTSMLLVSCLTFSLVTVFYEVLQEYHKGEPSVQDIMLPVSRVASIIIIMAYVAYIIFQLVTHKGAMSTEAEEEDDEGSISLCGSLVLLLLTTVVVAYASGLLVDAIDGVVAGAHLSEHFIGIILLPIVGNACEHAAAVRFAVQDKLGLSVGIAVGSSTQIALFVVPLSVLAGWAIGQPMDLNFGILNSSLITLSVIVVLSMVVDGQSNWLQGYLLCSVYAIIAVMYWNLPNGVHDSTEDF